MKRCSPRWKTQRERQEAAHLGASFRRRRPQPQHHLYALLEMCKKEGLDRVYVHCFMDGRDVSPTSGAGFVRDLQNEMKKIGVGKSLRCAARYYAMDRDNRWERVVQAYEMLTLGNGIAAEDPAAADRGIVRQRRDGRVHPPTNVVENGAPGRSGRERGQRDLLQLPPRPRARDHPRVYRAGF